MGQRLFAYKPSTGIAPSGVRIESTIDIGAYQVSGLSKGPGAVMTCLYVWSGSIATGQWIPLRVEYLK